MNSLSVCREHASDATAVSNLFIDEYMYDCNGAELKVYLYLLRALESGENVSVCALADRFNYTEGDITRSLDFWEKKGLLRLDRDARGNLSGIRFVDIHELSSRRNATIVPLNLEKRNAKAGLNAKAVSEDTASKLPEKTPRTPSALRSLRENADIQELLFVSESYLGHPLKPADLQSLLYIHEDLAFSTELTDYLIESCVEQGNKDFSHIETIARSWYLQGIRTPKAAAKVVKSSDKFSARVMDALGRSGKPTGAELSFILRWVNEYGFSEDMILAACERASINTESGRIKYTDGILQNWKKDQIYNKEDLASYEDARKLSKEAPQTARPSNRFNDHMQSKYDFDALEKELISN